MPNHGTTEIAARQVTIARTLNVPRDLVFEVWTKPEHDVGLVGKYYLTLNPAILGGGRRLFDDLHNKIDLILTDAQMFSTGAIACHYVKA